MASVNPNQTQPQGPSAPSPAVPVMESASLFVNDLYQEILIMHGGKVYRLRKTRQGKLILTT
jgi:hemin uptake protein HemP